MTEQDDMNSELEETAKDIKTDSIEDGRAESQDVEPVAVAEAIDADIPDQVVSAEMPAVAVATDAQIPTLATRQVAASSPASDFAAADAEGRAAQAPSPAPIDYDASVTERHAQLHGQREMATTHYELPTHVDPAAYAERRAEFAQAMGGGIQQAPAAEFADRREQLQASMTAGTGHGLSH